MRALYDIAERYNNIYELLENEEIPIEVIEEALKEIEEELEDKFDNIASLIKMFEGKVQIFKQEEQRLNERRTVYENRIKYLKNYALNHLDFVEKTKIEGKKFTVRKQASPRTINIDEKQLDKKYLVPQPSKPNSKLIRQELKEGKEVKGAKYNPKSYHLRIQ